MGNLMTQTSGNDSLETYSIFWLDASAHNEENIKAQKKLRSIVNQLRTFVDPEEFLDGVRLIQQGDLTILIVSGQMGRIVVPEMQKLAQVSSIYVYCFDKEANLQWSQPYKKVKAVCTKLDELIDIIRVDQKNRGRNEEALAMDILDRSSTELNDIYEQLLAHQCQKRVTVYRGQVLSIVEYKKLEKSCGSIISLNSFLSTSLNRRIAEGFVQQNKHLCASGDHVVVIFEIEADPAVVRMKNGNNRRPFTQIDELSYYGEESEVLFMLGSIFQLNEISHDQSSSSLSADATMSIIRMTLCSDHDNDLKQLYDHMKNEYDREETNLLSLGDVTYRMGKFDLAEKYYRRWLSELPSNDPSLGRLYQRLGRVADAKGEYDTSLEWYQKSLEMKMRTRPSDHVNIGITHNTIGNVHRNKGDRGRALESYNRAVSLFKQAHDENHPHLASFYNNIGIIYREEKKYFEALDFYEKSLSLRRKHLPSDHPDLGSSYNNVGIVHYCLDHYDLALDHYNRSLKIKLKSLPAQHPDIAMTYENMGIVYEDKDDFEQTLIYMKKAQAIYEVALPLNHPNVVNIKNNVKRVEDK
ncbi:unnamed protein product [Rotaria magnacalcarata]